MYGVGGVGKTYLLSTMPKKGLVIDVPQVEGGTSVLSHTKNIMVLPVTRWEEIDDAFKYLRHAKHDYSWVAIDTMTAMQELAKRRAVQDRAGDISIDPKITTMQDWGKIGNLMGEMIFKFRTLPIHVIFLAQENTRETTGMPAVYEPAVAPATMQTLLPSLSLCGRLTVVEVEKNDSMVLERQMRVAPGPSYKSKFRAVKGRELPNVVANPNLGEMLAYLLGKEVQKPEAAAKEDSDLFVE